MSITAEDAAAASAARCAAFVADVDPALAYRVPHDNFPIITDPPFVPAPRAHWVRPDDWVIGVRIGGTARCYPAYMLDNSHVVNDTVEGRHYAVIHCEICCSNAVFEATRDGRRLTFGTGGLFGGTLALFDEQTRSLWSHGMGAAFDGALAGTSLPRVESFQASYAEWLALHPDTEVMVWTAPEMHPDARHGHGTDAWFAQPGIERLVLRTMAAGNDDRLPEHEMVVSLFAPGGNAAVPLREVMRAGGVLASQVGGDDVVTLSAGPDSALTGTFHPWLRDDPDTRVALAPGDGGFVDGATGSVFRVDGLAVWGPLAGRRLQPLATMTNKWHSLTCFLPGTPIVRAAAPGVPPHEGQLAPVLRALRDDGFSVAVTRRLYALELPHEARCGVAVELDGDPCELFLFSDESVAEDELLWRAHALQAGPVVLASTPPRWSDATNTTPVPDDERAWSPLIGDAGLHLSLYRAACAVPTGRIYPDASLTELVAGLRAGGVKVAVRRASYRETLPPGAVSGMVADLDGDPFIVLRFAGAAAAARGAPLPAYSVVAGHVVVQSDPPDLYASLDRGTLRRPDDVVSWSPLLASADFAAAVRAAAGAGEG